MTPQVIADYAMRLKEGRLKEGRLKEGRLREGALGDGESPQPPLAPASVARALVAVRMLHKFALVEGLASTDPAARVHPPRPAQRLPKAMSIDDVDRLLSAPALDNVLGLRDRALLEVLYGTGARISEAVALDVDDLGESLRLLGKGNKERIVPLGSYAKAALDAYLVRARPELSAKGAATPALFLNSRGGRLSRQGAWLVLHQTAEAAGLRQAISPHTLRHSYATHLLDGGADVRVVQELLGHASVTTTQIYTRITVDSLRAVYRSAHPRAY